MTAVSGLPILESYFLLCGHANKATRHQHNPTDLKFYDAFLFLPFMAFNSPIKKCLFVFENLSKNWFSSKYLWLTIDEHWTISVKSQIFSEWFFYDLQKEPFHYKSSFWRNVYMRIICFVKYFLYMTFQIFSFRITRSIFVYSSSGHSGIAYCVAFLWQRNLSVFHETEEKTLQLI